MSANDVAGRLLDVLGATVHAAPVQGGWVAGGVAMGVLLVATPLWDLVRPLVTVVHELGHALVGMLCGRGFTGFVVSADMSGHTVTRGRPRGPGIVLTTAAGYPMPALVGALVIWAASLGWAQLVVLVSCAAFLVALVRSRSVLTVMVLVALVVGSGALWWAHDPALRPGLVTALGVVLIAGAWRQWAAVARTSDPTQDPGQLARLSGVPAGVWTFLFLAVISASTAWAVRGLWPRLVDVAAFLGAS